MAARGDLHVGGMVDRPRSWTLAELTRLPGQVADVGLVVPGKAGRGVRLQALLDASRPRRGATHATLEAADGNAASVPLAALEGAVLVLGLEDGPLPKEQGGPIRILLPAAVDGRVPGVDGCAHVKQLVAVRLTEGLDAAAEAAHAALHAKKGHPPPR